jgi:hypothetical protein
MNLKVIFDASSLGSESYKWTDENCNKQNTFFCELPKLCMPEKCKVKKGAAAATKSKFLTQCPVKSCSFCSDVSKTISYLNYIKKLQNSNLRSNINTNRCPRKEIKAKVLVSELLPAYFRNVILPN